MSVFQKQFSIENDAAEPAKIKRAVIIASTQRSGSSLLGHTLRDTGGYGVPLEYFSVQNLSHWRKRFEFSSINGFLDQIEQRRTTANGVFGIKCHYFQLNNFGCIRDLQTRYGDCRFLRIVREDVLAQAISRTVAEQTGVWISGQPKTGEARYDFHRIAENLRILNQQDQQWSLALAATGTKFLTVTHESLIKDPIAEVRRISTFCDIDEKQLVIPQIPPIKPQRHSEKAEWAERFADNFEETSETLLNGYQSPGWAAKDLGRWLRTKVRVPSKSEKWYRSPNLATD